jgi:hypothetical protein
MKSPLRFVIALVLVLCAVVIWTGCSSSNGGGTVTTYVGVSHPYGYGPGWGAGWGGYYPGYGGGVVVGPPVAVPYY